MKLGIPIGFSTTFWFVIGLIRTIEKAFTKNHPQKVKPKNWEKVSIKDIAVILPAHNEEAVIAKSLKALKYSIPAKQIHVVSDGSSDNTYSEVKKQGCRVIAINPGVGKARALVRLIERFNLYEKYKFIMILDADTKVDKDYFKFALPVLENPEISAVFPGSRIRWKQHLIPELKYFYIAYRERLNRMLQYFLVYGQTWKRTNASFVIPGYCTIYRASVLRQLRIDTPGLLIEDFNLAFQLHHKKLGKIYFDPELIGWDQHPDNLKDYWKQVRRWNIGFFQTVRANGFWPSFFWFSMAIFSIEVAINGMFILIFPFLLIVLALADLPVAASTFEPIRATLSTIPFFRALEFTWFEIFLTFFWFDYTMTIIFGIMGRKPQFLFYGLFFFFMHYVTALILLTAFIPGFFSKSDGRWNSPKRHALNG